MEELTVVIALTMAMNTAAMAEMMALIPAPMAEKMEPYCRTSVSKNSQP